MTHAPYLRLGGCCEGPASRVYPFIEGLCSIHRAEFFTLYLMDREGMAHALTDHATLMGGVRTMLRVAHAAGLEGTLCPFLSAGEVR